MRAVNTTKNIVLVEKLEWAGTSETRRRGLLGRDTLPPDEGIYITPTQWLHTFRMRFAIDIAFLNGDGVVLAVHHALPPNRLSRLVWRADGALETAAGRLQETGTQRGDRIVFEEAD